MNNPRNIGFNAISRILTFALIGCLSACDFLYGVRRSSPIHADPTPECVERVLSHTSEIASVKHEHVIGGYPLTWTGFKSPDVTETFYYQGPDNVRGALTYTKDYKGHLTLEQSSFGINIPPPQEVINATRPVMRKIEIALESECGLNGLTAQVKEWCHKEVCRSLQ